MSTATTPGPAPEFESVPADSTQAQTAVLAYFAEIARRFPNGFDPGDGWLSDAGDFASPYGDFVIAHVGDEVVACGGVRRIDPGVAEIKRMYVAPGSRGTGLGRRLLAHLESQARALGHHTVRLDTNGVLAEAIAMYGRAGYDEIASYNDNPYAEHWFEKALGPET